MAAMTPTDEQVAAVELFGQGRTMVIEAGAGTGKTSTLRLIAEAAPAKRIQYLAFNKAIVTDAAGSMPPNVTASTAHSLAYRAVGAQFGHRLRGSRRMRSMEIARLLGVDPLAIDCGGRSKYMAAGFLAGLAMRAIERFCQTADLVPSAAHVPYIDGIDVPVAGPNDTMRRGWANNREVAKHLEPALRRAWMDLSQLNGVLPFKHSHYLKLWQLSRPRIHADVILFDEAQDANPVMAAVVGDQPHAQVVYVGDSQQAIYEWTGAVNALAGFAADDRSMLTRSFRFGPEVASVANDVLGRIPGADLRLVGAGSAGVVGPVAEPDVVLCRTNAAAVDRMLLAQQAGLQPHLVGGGSEVVTFAKAAQELMDEGRTYHPELACFDGWTEVLDYVENDAQGGELNLLVGLVEKYGVPTILLALDYMPTEDRADLIVSTAHKAKGRQWGSVALAGDFPTGKHPKTGEPVEPDVSELRLLYVAVTRAQRELDISACGLLADVAAPLPSVAPGPLHCRSCGRAYTLSARSGLADEEYCGGVCRSKDAMKAQSWA